MARTSTESISTNRRKTKPREHHNLETLIRVGASARGRETRNELNKKTRRRRSESKATNGDDQNHQYTTESIGNGGGESQEHEHERGESEGVGFGGLAELVGFDHVKPVG
jgi:hypothetical protein